MPPLPAKVPSFQRRPLELCKADILWVGCRGHWQQDLFLALWAVCLDSVPWAWGLPSLSQARAWRNGLRSSGREERDSSPDLLFSDKKHFYKPTVLSSPLCNVLQEKGGLWESTEQHATHLPFHVSQVQRGLQEEESMCEDVPNASRERLCTATHEDRAGVTSRVGSALSSRNMILGKDVAVLWSGQGGALQSSPTAPMRRGCLHVPTHN